MHASNMARTALVVRLAIASHCAIAAPWTPRPTRANGLLAALCRAVGQIGVAAHLARAADAGEFGVDDDGAAALASDGGPGVGRARADVALADRARNERTEDARDGADAGIEATVDVAGGRGAEREAATGVDQAAAGDMVLPVARRPERRSWRRMRRSLPLASRRWRPGRRLLRRFQRRQAAMPRAPARRARLLRLASRRTRRASRPRRAAAARCCRTRSAPRPPHTSLSASSLSRYEGRGPLGDTRIRVFRVRAGVDSQRGQGVFRRNPGKGSSMNLADEQRVRVILVGRGMYSS